MSNATELLRRALFELAKYAPTEKSAENLFLDIKSYFDSEPEQSKWQGLSYEEMDALFDEIIGRTFDEPSRIEDFGWEIVRALKEKNTIPSLNDSISANSQD